MDRLAGPNTAQGWFAFDAGPLGARQIAARVAERAKIAGLEARMIPAATFTRLVVSYPEGRAMIDVFDVPRGVPRRALAICHRGASAAVAQARTLLRESIDRSGELTELVACDEATWKALPELAEHREAVRRQRAARVVAGIGLLAAIPAAFLIALFVFYALAATNMTCGSEPRGSHAGWVLTIGLVGLALFAVAFLPGILLLRSSKRTLGRSLAGALLASSAVVIAIVDWMFLLLGTSC